jgi:hypothetical protein
MAVSKLTAPSAKRVKDGAIAAVTWSARRVSIVTSTIERRAGGEEEQPLAAPTRAARRTGPMPALRRPLPCGNLRRSL